MIKIKDDVVPNIQETIELFKSVGWGHTDCPEALNQAILNSDLVITAWNNDKLIGIGRAISDKSLSVYFPDLLIHPDWQKQGIGTQIIGRLLNKYSQFHNQVLVAEDKIAQNFYKKNGFKDEESALSITKSFPPE